MSDDLDLDMEVVGDDELDKLGADGASSSEEHISAKSGEETPESEGLNMEEKSKDYTTSSDDRDRSRRKELKENVGDSRAGGSLYSLPEDWSVHSLSSDFDIEYGDEKQPQELEEGYPLYGANGIIGRSDKYLFEEPIVTVTCRGATCGNVHLTEPKSWVTNNSLVLLKRSELNNYFVADALRYHSVERAITGSAQQQITSGMLGKMDYPVPSLPEQRKIASVLYAVDQAIQKTEAIIEQAQRVKRGLMQKVFLCGLDSDGDIRDAEISPGDFKSLNLGGFEERLVKKGRVPESWNYLPLEECLFEFVSGAAISSGEFSEEGFPVVAKGDVTDDEVIDLTSDRQRVPVETAQKYSSSVVDSSYVVVSLRDLVPSAPTVGSASFVDAEGQFLLAQGAYGLSLDEEKLNPKFFVTLTRCHYFRSYMKRMAVGSTQVHVRSTEYKSMRIPVPPIEEQRRISALFEAIDGQIRNAQSRVSNFKNLKKGLMQDLLTGEVRTADKAVDVLDEVVEHG